MSAVYAPDDLPTDQLGMITRTILANPALLGCLALYVEHLTLPPGAASPPASSPQAEHFLYVVRGAGTAHVGAEQFSLQPEALLWLEAGDVYHLQAGSEELAVLACRAPAAE